MPLPAFITDKRGGVFIERTISGMLGKGSFNHNNRSFSAKNVDSNRTYLNVAYCENNIKQVYRELFDEALERHNAKQTRSDRKIAKDILEEFAKNFQDRNPNLRVFSSHLHVCVILF